MQTLKNIGAWVRNHFDFALLLAAAVEIPRWTVTFLAIHEPLWVGIPLGALLAYATSEGWKAYFVDTRRVKLLCFNIASLAAATFVITPVLFSMASAPIDEIDLAALLPFGWLLAWSSVLAVTTFAPLIQLAAVKSTPAEKPAEAAATQNDTTLPVQAPVALPVGTTGHSSDVSPTQVQPVESQKGAKKPRAVNEYGVTDRQIAEWLNVKRQAIGPMRKRGTLHTRIARELPQLVKQSSNGYNHSNGD